MILGFKTRFPDGRPTLFKVKILNDEKLTGLTYTYPKIHSMRLGSRWRKGMKIHMATGVRTKEYNQFNKNIKGLEECTAVQKVEFYRQTEFKMYAKVGGKKIQDYNTLTLLALNDGFCCIDEMFTWFVPKNKDRWIGQIVHWTDFRY